MGNFEIPASVVCVIAASLSLPVASIQSPATRWVPADGCSKFVQPKMAGALKINCSDAPRRKEALSPVHHRSLRAAYSESETGVPSVEHRFVLDEVT